MNAAEMTPCGVMFDLLKRRGGVGHSDLAELILSSRPLADGRSPVSRASDRSWVSRFIVHAPVGSLQSRYFCDYATSAVRVMNRLRARGRRQLTVAQVLDMVCGQDGRAMDRALTACHQSAQLYRNALDRLSRGVESGHTAGERAEVALVLLVAVGCSANVQASLAYTMEYAQRVLGMRMNTPESTAVAGIASVPERAAVSRPIGLMRVEGGYVTGSPHWVPPTATGVEIGALTLDENGISDVAADVSARHARVWHEEGAEDGSGAGWFAEDLGSKNGTVLVSGADRSERPLEQGCPVPLTPGDELRLGAETVFTVIEGAPLA